MQLRQVVLQGKGCPAAIVRFVGGANIVAGVSDTGKSFIVRCVDYVLGANELGKSISEADGYEHVLLEFQNADGQFLTLKRHLTGGDIAVLNTRIEDMGAEVKFVKHRRHGKSTAEDVTSVFLAFAGISEAQLRTNSRGKTERLTVRTLLPAFLVDDGSMQAERSPVFLASDFQNTASKRMLAFLLTGKDDAGIVAQERRDIARAKLQAQIGVVEQLLGDTDNRSDAQIEDSVESEDSTEPVERIDAAIASLTDAITASRDAQVRLSTERKEVAQRIQRADVQGIALNELLKRYELLDQRYASDLDRLDFLAEGAHFFGGLQEVRCPLCGQPMGTEHQHAASAEPTISMVYAAARAEAAKILALRNDLSKAVEDLRAKSRMQRSEAERATSEVSRIDARIDNELVPVLGDLKLQLDTLVERKVNLQEQQHDREQADSLRALKNRLEGELKQPPSSKTQWALLDGEALRKFCKEIEMVLKTWNWIGEGRVEFDEKTYDIRIDGKSRQSHGQGVRAVLHSAFKIGLLNYCQKENKPHPGFLILDSPLTTFKQHSDTTREAEVDPGIIAAFWQSLASTSHRIQIIVFDNKEPPASVASTVNYIWFAGPDARSTQRQGFIPPPPSQRSTV